MKMNDRRYADHTLIPGYRQRRHKSPGKQTLFYTVVKETKLIAEKITLPGCRLKNFYRIGNGIYRSDQPTYKCFRELEKFGIDEVLNLRNMHNDNDEAKGTSIRLHHLRTRASRMSLDDLVNALRIIRDRKGPLLFHCWHGSDRTGAVAAMYRIVFQRVSKDDAIHEMTESTFGFHMTFDGIIDVIYSANIAKIRRDLFNRSSLSESASPARYGSPGI